MAAPWTAVAPAPRLPAADDVAALATAAETVERGLVVLGDSGADVRALLDLARLAGWPVIAEPSSNARTGGQVISTAALLLGHERFAAAHRPDLVLTAGRVGLARSVLGVLAAAEHVVRVDPHGGWLDPVRSASRLVVADAAALVDAVRTVAAPPDRRDWLAAWCDAELAARAVLDALLDAEDAPTEPRTARDLAAALPDGALLFGGSSMPIRDLDLTMHPRQGLRVLANRGASGIDGLVSTAVGAARVHEGRSAALLGDLALLHDHNGLLMGGEPWPHLVLVVLDNDGGGIFSLLPQAGTPGFERVFGTPHHLDVGRVVAAAGRTHVRLQRAADLPAALVGGADVIEVRTDRQANAALHARMRAAVHP